MACKTVIRYPLPVNHNLSISQSPSNPDEQQKYNDHSGDIHYLSLIGSLLFATQTQPDIQFAIGLTAQFSGNPGIPHLAAEK